MISVGCKQKVSDANKRTDFTVCFATPKNSVRVIEFKFLTHLRYMVCKSALSSIGTENASEISDGGNAPICPLRWRKCTYLPSQMEGMHLFALSDGGNAPICSPRWRECTYLPSQMEGMHLFALSDGGNAPICPLIWRSARNAARHTGAGLHGSAVTFKRS